MALSTRARLSPLGLAAALLMVSCGAAVAPEPGGGARVRSAAGSSQLAGSVVAGPVCPVQRAERPCRPRPVPNAKVELLRGGGIVRTLRSDSRGGFRITTRPGAFAVRATNVGGYRSQTSKVVRLRAGDTVHVVLLLDTGIR